MEDQNIITREIGIDAAHRVPDHRSKCKNVHGHRYTIFASCSGPVAEDGEQRGMVLDFGFLKEIMLNEIDAFCDHGAIFSLHDPKLKLFLQGTELEKNFNSGKLAETFNKQGYLFCVNPSPDAVFGKLYVIQNSPTAEVLAKHWYDRLKPHVRARSDNRASLVNVRVSETPNCYADYPGFSYIQL